MKALRAPKVNLEKYGSLIALGVLAVASTIVYPRFVEPQNLLNILRQVSYTGIIGLGMTFVIISGGIDLSVGSMAALAGSVAILMLNLVTDLGDVDLTFTPSGGLGGFDEWSAQAIVVEIAAGLSVRIASLDDIIDSKRAANRPKDQMALPYLESLREELRGR